MGTRAPEVGIAFALLAAVAAFFAAPSDTAAFYSAAAQVNPVFLVALAVERSLAEALGTETQYVNELRNRLATDYEPSLRNCSILSAVRDVLLRHSVAANAPYPGGDEWIVGHHDYEAADGLLEVAENEQWEVFTQAVDAERQAKPHLRELGAWADAQGQTSSAVEMLALVAYLAKPIADINGSISGREVLAFVDQIYEEGNARELHLRQDAAAGEAVVRYRALKRKQRRTLLFSILLLAVGELLAFAG